MMKQEHRFQRRAHLRPLAAAGSMLVAILAAVTSLLAGGCAAKATVATSHPLTLEEATAGTQPKVGEMAPGVVANEGEAPAEASPQSPAPASNATRRMLQQNGCSSTAWTAAAVRACTNAVRINPDVLSDAPCFASVRASITDRVRLPLQTQTGLTKTAASHNALMTVFKQVSHELPGERSFGERVISAGYPWSTVAENVAQGYASAKAVVTAWLCSDAHRENLFSCAFSDIGVASGGTRYFTQVFGCRAGMTCNSCEDNTIQWVELAVHPQHTDYLPMCMNIRGGAAGNGIAVQQWGCNKSTAQKFRLVAAAADGITSYWNVVDSWGRCLQVAGSTSGAPLNMWKCLAGARNQQFLFEELSQSPPTYRMRPRHSNLCISVIGALEVAGTNYIQYDCNGAPDQHVVMYDF